jgi:hypothetical protein
MEVAIGMGQAGAFHNPRHSACWADYVFLGYRIGCKWHRTLWIYYARNENDEWNGGSF